jgi:PCO_ADO
VKAGPEGCAFLDVLMPPYKEGTPGRDCSYYRSIADTGSNSSSNSSSSYFSSTEASTNVTVLLEKCLPPADFAVMRGTISTVPFLCPQRDITNLRERPL